jgi:ABC-type bacteriocin/lantibiotic exporter with double-glycine peptidase domain
MSVKTEEKASIVLPTNPCSVVWSKGHAYVLEGAHGRTRWVGIDGRGKPQSFSSSDLERRGWTRTRAR